MPTHKNASPHLPGKASLFRNKVRAPVSITLTAEHHWKVRRAMKRLGLTRADLIALLIDRYADVVRLPDRRRRMVTSTSQAGHASVLEGRSTSRR